MKTLASKLGISALLGLTALVASCDKSFAGGVPQGHSYRREGPETMELTGVAEDGTGEYTYDEQLSTQLGDGTRVVFTYRTPVTHAGGSWDHFRDVTTSPYGRLEDVKNHLEWHVESKTPLECSVSGDASSFTFCHDTPFLSVSSDSFADMNGVSVEVSRDGETLYGSFNPSLK